MSASTHFAKVSSVGALRPASSKSLRTSSVSSSAEGRGSSITITSGCNSAGSVASGSRKQDQGLTIGLELVRKFQIPCSTSVCSQKR